MGCIKSKTKKKDNNNNYEVVNGQDKNNIQISKQTINYKLSQIQSTIR